MSSIVTPTGSTNQPGAAALVAPSAREFIVLCQCPAPSIVSSTCMQKQFHGQQLNSNNPSATAVRRISQVRQPRPVQKPTSSDGCWSGRRAGR